MSGLLNYLGILKKRGIYCVFLLMCLWVAQLPWNTSKKGCLLYIFTFIMQVMLIPQVVKLVLVALVTFPIPQNSLEQSFSRCDFSSLSILPVCCELCLCDNGNSLKGIVMVGMLKMYL